MSKFKPYTELSVLPRVEEGPHRIVNGKGEVFAECFDTEDAYRIVDCWNALRKIAFPASHLEATTDYTVRLEQLRKEAVAKVHEFDPSWASKEPA